MGKLKQNLNSIKERIARAAERAGRQAAEVKLVAVTKTVSAQCIREAVEAGVRDIGENRVQEALSKYEKLNFSIPTLAEVFHWHMIGHLQKNKVKKALKIFNLIHSLDSLDLAQEIDKQAGSVGKKAEALLQVNVAEEESKFGVSKEETRNFLTAVSGFDNLKIRGLMTIAPYSDDPEDSRPYFRQLKDLSEEIKNIELDNVEMEYLSMGMSQDFEVAIEEGANIIRLGSVIFGSRI